MDKYSTLTTFFVLFLASYTQAITTIICHGADYKFNCDDTSKVLKIERGLMELSRNESVHNCAEDPTGSGTIGFCQVEFGDSYSKESTPESLTNFRNIFYTNCWNKQSCSGWLPSFSDVVWSTEFTGNNIFGTCGLIFDSYFRVLHVDMKCVDPEDIGEITFARNETKVTTPTPLTEAPTTELTERSELTEHSELTPQPTDPKPTKLLTSSFLKRTEGLRLGVIIFGVTISVLFAALLVIIIVNHIRTSRHASVSLNSAQAPSLTPV